MDPKTHKVVHIRDVEFHEDSKRKVFTESKATFQSTIELSEGSSAEDSVDENPERSDESESTGSSNEEVIKNESIAVNSNISLSKVVDEPLRRSTRVSKPVIRDDFITYLTCMELATDPADVKEALNGPDKELWLQVIEEEKQSLIENNTWE